MKPSSVAPGAIDGVSNHFWFFFFFNGLMLFKNPYKILNRRIRMGHPRLAALSHGIGEPIGENDFKTEC